MVHSGEQRLFIGEAEVRALRLFVTGQVLGEALMLRPEVEVLADARSFFAQCLRREILVRVGVS